MQALNLAGMDSTMETILEHHFPAVPPAAPMRELAPVGNQGPQPFGAQMPIVAFGSAGVIGGPFPNPGGCYAGPGARY